MADIIAVMSGLSSQSIKFIVGPKKTEYYIVSALSPVLNTLINDQMKESSGGVVNWESANDQVFMCFNQFINQSKYDVLELSEPSTTASHEQPEKDPIIRVLCNFKVLKLAGFYQMSDLEEFAMGKLYQSVLDTPPDRYTEMPPRVRLFWREGATEQLDKQVCHRDDLKLWRIWMEDGMKTVLDR